ncbi:MAG: hypothetical protein K8S27_03355 [Candidatus Omnitrophica bacterium]|nr:hypothetical protein [Candidatus Omnitrophota bacterium]
MANPIHSFHMPVMGTGFTIDAPLKVAKYGISSSISLVDDVFIEQMRKYHCNLSSKPYTPITRDTRDCRAERITSYLNLINELVTQQFETLQRSNFEPGSDITKYFMLLPDNTALKELYHQMLSEKDGRKKKLLQDQLRELIRPGSIDVNIMTKLDRQPLDNSGVLTPPEFSDAMSALRGYAQSKLESAIIFSAGINRKLYTYIEKFNDFFMDARGQIRKKIILKVSDYRSSFIQGSFIAQKGLWVSEYRIESGLNCGGHAFPTKGQLLGPILEEFKNKRSELKESILRLLRKALHKRNCAEPEDMPDMRITVQGGIANAIQDQFLMNNYGLDGTGWGTAFLFCPEAVNMDDDTLNRLLVASDDDLFLSDASPLNVYFCNLRTAPCEEKRKARIDEGQPGSPCPKGFLTWNSEFTENPVCIASRQYQKKKIEQLQSLHLDDETYQNEVKKVTDKACICHDLSGSAMRKYKLANYEKSYPAICPSPVAGYFSKIVTLVEKVSHIYGRMNLITSKEQPNLFIKELKLYVEHFKKELNACAKDPSSKEKKFLNEFKNNLMDGIEYYQQLFPIMINETQDWRDKAVEDLKIFQEKIDLLVKTYQTVFSPLVSS